ncbi:hypothetical protein ABCR94_38615, partial [Streptomyces sp. 21So2-11]
MPLTAQEAFQRYQQEHPRIKAAAQATETYLRNRAARKGIACQVASRAKEVSSFNTKMYRKDKGYTDPWKQITDKAGVRFV